VLGIGSDSGGSIRLPAAWCGVYGFKPSAGLVPTTGHFPRVGALSDGRTQIGPMSADLDLIERVLSIIAGPDWHDAGVVPVAVSPVHPSVLDGARFAVLDDDPNWPLSAATRAAVELAAQRLEASGLRRVPWRARWLGDALDITRGYWSRSTLSGEQAERQLWDWDRFRRRYLEAAEHIELLITPTVAGVAPRHRPITGEDYVFTLPASLTGSPAIAVPAGIDASGLPLSVQVVGRPFEDHRVLAAARIIGDERPP
jgi:amidase